MGLSLREIEELKRALEVRVERITLDRVIARKVAGALDFFGGRISHSSQVVGGRQHLSRPRIKFKYAQDAKLS